MTIHSFNIFDRKGKSLFTKTYSTIATKQQRYLQESGASEPGSDPVKEQRKLVFGMLFSLRELVASLTPEDVGRSLQSVKTGSTTVHTFETMSGLYFALYTSNDVPATNTSERSDYSETTFARDVLRHVYSNLWVECVIRSPMHVPGAADIDVNATTFEKELDSYLSSLPWFR